MDRVPEQPRPSLHGLTDAKAAKDVLLHYSQAYALQMAIRKQEFYEGAALHILSRGGRVDELRYKPPLFVVNGDYHILIKYSTKGRSPWAFTFMPEEQGLLAATAARSKVRIGLVCGGDGVVALTYEAFATVAEPRNAALHLACYRNHGQHYEVNGPDGTLNRKVAPSAWQRILED